MKLNLFTMLNFCNNENIITKIINKEIRITIEILLLLSLFFFSFFKILCHIPLQLVNSKELSNKYKNNSKLNIICKIFTN